MPVVATENFSGTADVTLQGKTTTTGGLTWAASGAFVPDEQGLKLNGSGVGKNSSTNGCLSYVNAGAADSYAQARFLDGFTTNQGISVAVACVDLNNWIALCTFVAGQVRLLKRVGGTLSAVATITGLTLTSGDVFKITREGTTVKLYQNGVQIGVTAGYTVADAVFTGVTNVGLWAKVVSTSLVDDFEAGTMAAGGTLTIGSGPMANQVYQRAPGGTSKAVSLSGSYTGADPASIQAQIETVGGSVLSAWATLSGVTIGSGSWSGASVTVPQRPEWLLIKLRSRDSGGTTLATAQTGQFGVGVHVHIDGQSNGLGMSSVSGGTATTAAVAEWTGSAWTTASGMGGAGERAFGQELATLLGVAVGFSNSSVGATAIDQHKPPSGSQWTDTAAMMAAVGGDAEVMLWCQGESNAGTTDVSASYSTSLQDIANGMLTLTGRTASQFRMFVSVTGRNEGSTQGNAIGWQSVRIGQANAAAAHAAIDISHDCIDFAMSDGVHYAAAGQTEHGYRFARSVAKWLGASAYDGRGPRVASASISGSTVTVAFDLNGSASLTGTGTLTGWEFFNGTTWAAATDAARVGNTVTFTAAGATAVRHLYGQDPDVSNLARGNLTPSASSSIGLPVEPTRADVAVTASAVDVAVAGQGGTIKAGIGAVSVDVLPVTVGVAGTGATIKAGTGAVSVDLIALPPGTVTTQVNGAGATVKDGYGAISAIVIPILPTVTAEASGIGLTSKAGFGSVFVIEYIPPVAPSGTPLLSVADPTTYLSVAGR